MSNSLTYLGKTYTDDEIVSGAVSRKQSLNMAELTVDTAEITLRPHLNLDFFTSDPYPFFTSDRMMLKTKEVNYFADGFQQDDPIDQYIDGQPYARWYLQSIERIAKDQYVLSGTSSLGRLTNITHYGGVYDHVPAYELIYEIIGTALQYEIDPSFEDVEISGWLPIASARDNLQQVIFALNAGLQTDTTGKLYIRNIYNAGIPTIQGGNIYSGNAAVRDDVPITKVVVVEHSYIRGNETKTLFSGEVVDNQRITFNEPIDVATLAVSPNTFTISESNANYAVIAGTGTCTLTGTPYVHITREFSADVTDASQANIVRVENATLVNVENSTDVVARLVEYYKHRKRFEVGVNQLINVGTVANICDPYDGGMSLACVEKSQIALSSQIKSVISALVGFEPWEQTNFVTVHDIITQDGPYTFPNNLVDGTGVQVTLIGGGNGGSAGGDGNRSTIDGRQTTQIVVTVNTPTDDDNGRALQNRAGLGGIGGIGGNGGLGGNVYTTIIGVNHSQTFNVTIGAGGLPGETGGETTFGDLSSAQGERSDTGYADYDPDTQTTTVYAKQGTNGANGANGGNGMVAENGENGGNVGSYVGGSGGALHAEWHHITSLGGAGGGGASLGNNGNSAGAWALNERSSGQYTEYGFDTVGANGANAASPSAPSALLYGTGGSGGNGGGGGGGAGGYSGQAIVADNEYYRRWVMTQTGGNGGSGTIGTAGNQGCVIITYRKPI